MSKNRGFTLVELLLSIAILSIVLTTVTALMLSGSRQFTKGNADATMQREAQLVVNQIEDMVIDTNGGIFYTDEASGRKLVLYNAVSSSGTITYTKEVIEWVAADKEILYHKFNVRKDATTNTFVEDGTIYADQLMAENITDFKVDLSDTKKDRDKDGNEIDIVKSVQIVVGCEGNDGLVTYATNPVTTLRNRMMLSNDAGIIFTNTPVVEENLSLYISDAGGAARTPIQYPGTVVERLKYYNIYAVVNDTYDVNSLVNWTIKEENALSTIDSAGKLWVNDLEPNNSLTIEASYKDNPGRKVSGVVAVGSNREIVSVQIIRLYSGDDAFKPKYDSNVKLDGFSEDDKSKLVYKWTISEPSWAESFNDSLNKLSLSVKQDIAYENKMFAITLTVSAPEFGCTPKSATVYFLIPTVGDTKSSYIERGKYNIEYNFATRDYYNVADPPYTVYFCDERGNRRTDLDYLIPKAIKIISCWAGGFNLEVTDDLPVNTEYYIKMIVYCIQDGREYNYERVFYIPAVELIGQDTTTAWKGIGSSHAGIEYKLYGYYSVAWDKTKYDIEVQEIVSNAPSGVEITARIGDSYILDSENNLMCSDVAFEITKGTEGIDIEDIKVKSIRVKIKMKDKEIFTYSTLTFTD